ncbi:2-amino-4-hydroxy-6-hydroxymethyldihydropteridine diphosphokinase [Actinotalea fermentans]|uniref:2-amino-4-hydroxy-6- hydroxymethyldihydropteridine diphosphokinase n=1 Tax=Actinotalea fermentans TaxID=43671 RepID=UPI001C9945B1|nr:2-amino-4-hydroxy-6-hydroxymethyldihydropteridine diphosphokinase [Actinotalea fermentans]
MADLIRLTGVSATGYHGVLPAERRDGQTFVADVVLHVDTREAAAGDRLDATVDYASVAVRVTEILAGAPADLIETVAERIAAALLADPRVSAVDVVLHKPQAPIPVPFTDVTVEIHRDRATPPAVPAPGVLDLTAGAGVPDVVAPPVAPLPPAPLPPAPMPPAPLPPAPMPPEALAPMPTWSPLSDAPEPPPVAPLPPAPAVAVAPVGGVAVGAVPVGAVPVGAVPPTIADLVLPTGAASSGAPGPEVTSPLEAGPAADPFDVPALVPDPLDPAAGAPADAALPGPGGDAPAPRGQHAAAPPPSDRMDVAPEAPVQAVLALGSNVGASQDTLRAAVRALADVPGIEVSAVGPLARTAAVGGPEQPDFLNTVVLVGTVLSPRALLHACLEVEAGLGRVRAERWGPRTLDVDVIVHGSTIGVTDDLELPHPRAHERAFVLLPWAQVDPGAVLPGLGGGPVAALAETAPDREGVRWVNLDWWTAG